MSKLIEFLFGSILMTILSIALIVFSMLHYIVRAGGIADCAWHGLAKAWIDSNADGRINNGEHPLSGVEIHINNLQDQPLHPGWTAVTDKNGDAPLNVLMPGCSDVLLEVYASVPDGYLLTTEPRIAVNRGFWGSLFTKNVYYFGFVSQ